MISDVGSPTNSNFEGRGARVSDESKNSHLNSTRSKSSCTFTKQKYSDRDQLFRLFSFLN